MLRALPLVAAVILTGPILVGLVSVLLPAFGHFPAIGAHGFSLTPFGELFDQPGLFRMVLISFVSGILTTAISLAIVALFLAGFAGTRLFQWVRRAISPLLSVPHAAAAFGLAVLIAPSGILARFVSPSLTGWERPPDLLIVHDTWGLTMMLGLIVKEVPFLFLVALAALPQVDAPRRLQVARTLGYRPIAAWLKGVAPALYPLIRLPVYAVIAYATSSVDVALILGPTNPPTLAVAVVKWLNDPDLSMRLTASAGAVLQLLVTLGALLTWWIGERLVAWFAHGWMVRGTRSVHDGPLRAFAGIASLLVAGLALFGLIGLLIWSFAGLWRFPDALPQAFTLKTWLRAAPTLADPLWLTLAIGAISTLASLIVVLGALENEVRRGQPASRLGLGVLYLPLIVPQVAFLFGLIVAAEQVGVRPGFWPVAATHVIFVLPYVYLSLSEAYRRLDPRWAMLSATLGASQNATFWRVRLPMLLTPCLTAVAVGFAVSVGQYLATQLIGAGRVPTVTTEAVALASGGNRRIIGVWGLVQAVLPFVGFMLAVMLPRLVWRNRRHMREVG